MSSQPSDEPQTTFSGEISVPSVDPVLHGRLEPEHNPTLSIVLPTRNEEEGIEECITRIKRAVRELEMSAEIIVSDSSTDRTPEIARELGAIVVQPPKTGYGNAYLYAFEYAHGDFIVIGDADTTYDFEELPKLLLPVLSDEADLVLGSRFSGEIKDGAMPWLHQYIGNPLLTAFLNQFYSAGVSDAHSGFRVIRQEGLEQLDLQSGGMEFASEMIMDAAEKGLRIKEVPITYHQRVGEATLSSFRDGWRHVKFMLMNAPSYLFLIPCFIMGLVGALVSVGSVLNVQLGSILFGVRTMIVGSLLLIVAYQIGALGVFSAVATNPIKSPKGNLMDWLERNFSLEYGATAGSVLLGLGALVAGYLTVEWLSGRIHSPFVVASLLAYTAIVLGIQTVFSSFCLSMLLNGRRSR